MTDVAKNSSRFRLGKQPHEVNLRDVNFKEQTLVGTREFTRRMSFGQAVELTKNWKTSWRRILVHVVPLRESEKVFDMNSGIRNAEP